MDLIAKTQTFSWKSVLIKVLSLYCLLLGLGLNKASGTHLAGAEITCQLIDSLTYEVTLNYYYDCEGNPSPLSSVEIDYQSNDCDTSGTLIGKKVQGTGQEISPTCFSYNSSCNGGNFPGIRQFTYKDTITLPKCADWLFSWEKSNRNHAINTLDRVESMYVETKFNNKDFPDNSLPSFSNEPISFVCNNKDFLYNPGAVDPDNDSLSYGFYTPKAERYRPVNYLPGYSAQQPLQSSPPITIQNNGDIFMHPIQQVTTVVGVKVEDYSTDGRLQGYILRDMQIIVNNNCSSSPPAISGIDTTPSNTGDSLNYTDTICPGEQVEFFIHANDADTADNLTMEWNNGIEGGTFNVTDNGTPNPFGKFVWTPPVPTPGEGFQSNTFNIEVKDDHCPYNAFTSRGFNIKVRRANVISLRDTAYVPCNDSIEIAPDFPVDDTTYAVTWSNGSNQDSIWVKEPGKYWVEAKGPGNSCYGNGTFSDTFTVLPATNANFGIKDSPDKNHGCLKDTIQFNNTSLSKNSKINDWEWKFGDGDTSKAALPSHKYSDTGTYNVQLVVADTNDCYDTTNLNVSIDTAPKAGFQVDLGCKGKKSIFFDTSVGKIAQTNWRFGNGDSAKGPNPTNIYQNAGTYRVQQAITSAGGCRDTAYQQLPISKAPEVNFSTSNICHQIKTGFNADATIYNSGPIKAWKWHFGDGSVKQGDSTEQHIYEAPGNYSVLLTIETKKGCNASASKNVNIYEKPKLATSNDTAFCKGSNLKLGSSVEELSQYFVIEDDFNNQIDSSNWLDISNGHASSICGSVSGKALRFTGDNDRFITTNDVDVRSGGTIKFSIKFGNPFNDNPNCDDADPGEHVLLEYSKNGGQDWTQIESLDENVNLVFKSKEIDIPNFAKSDETRFRWRQVNVPPCSQDHCQAHWALDNIKIEKPVQTEVNWKPKKKLDLTDSLNPVTATSEATDFTIQAQYQNLGCTLQDTISVKPQDINVDFSVTNSGCVNDSVEFHDSSTIQNGNFKSTQWDFGDGSESTLKNPTHQYNGDDEYVVKLTRTSEIGCKDFKLKPVGISKTSQTGTIIRSTVKDDRYILTEWVLDKQKEQLHLEKNEGNNFDTLKPVKPSEQAFRDYKVDVDEQPYTYRIPINPDCDKVSYDNIAKTILLNSNLKNNQPMLEWTQYQGWDVSHYELQARQSPASSFQPLPGYEKIPPQQLKASGAQPLKTIKNRCFRVKAYKANDPSIYSTSNVDCIEKERKVFIPNSFSPNGDGINDRFKVRGQAIQDYQIKIYNRWGTQVYSGNQLKEGWDGRYKGQPVEEGTFIYIITVEGPSEFPKTYHGNLTVIK